MNRQTAGGSRYRLPVFYSSFFVIRSGRRNNDALRADQQRAFCGRRAVKHGFYRFFEGVNQFPSVTYSA
ncbi:MAG: hypothetical protein SOV73_01535 [Candidatus Faecivivens sp.]|nr:hypothetical protein [Candidatus Faecivivens sp.]